MTETAGKPDPLAALIVDGEELDKERIVEALKGTAGLNRRGEVVQLGMFAQLKARQKVLAYLLGYKAAEILGLRSDHTGGAAELARATGLAEGTVYPTLTQLRSDRAVSQDSNSRYFIAHHQVAGACDKVTSTSSSPTSGKKRPRRQRASPASPRRTEQKGDQVASAGTSTSGTSTAAMAAKPRRPTSNRFGSSDAVKSMIADGFFKKPKGLGDVRTHLKDFHARDIPVTTLSPLFTRLLRSGELKRAKNEQGTYEYFVPGAGG